jgi:hypothetical protein
MYGIVIVTSVSPVEKCVKRICVCLVFFIPPTDKMATYSIHAYDPESTYHSGQDRINNGTRYATFETACAEIEKRIEAHTQFYANFERAYDNIDKWSEALQLPNRDKKKQIIAREKYVNYHQCILGWVWVIKKWEVVE